MITGRPLPLRTFLVFATGLASLLTLFAWNTNAPTMGRVLTHGSDPLGYYQYLPALLIQGDWRAMAYVHLLENGQGLNLFSMGVAFMQAPFFLAAWAWCELMGIPATGYELPFVFARLLATSSYTALGSLILLNVLLVRSHRVVAWLSVLAILFGTTLYYYTVHEGGMSHAYCFFLMAAIVGLTDRMVRAPGGSTLVVLFLCLGLVVLIRPLHAVVGLFVLFHGTAGLADAWRTRVGWLRTYPGAAVTGSVVAVLVWLPQVLYWHTVTGSWFVFTYGTKGEGFDWLHPHLLDTLFSLQNGWFIHTPLMVVVMALLLWQAWRGEGSARPILFMWALVWYVYSSWWCWWLGGAFGYRGFIEYYAFLILPLAWGLERLRTVPRSWSIAVVLVLALLVRTNIRLGDRYVYPWERPSWTWEKLGRVYVEALWR